MMSTFIRIDRPVTAFRYPILKKPYILANTLGRCQRQPDRPMGSMTHVSLESLSSVLEVSWRELCQGVHL